MDRSFAAQRPRFAAPQPADALRAARRLLRGFRLRRRLAIALGLIVLLAGVAWFALRDSSLVSIKSVQIRGVHGVEAPAIRDALTRAARGQSTVHVNVGALMAAVAPYHVVKGLQVSSSFPHGVRIRVVEQLPVADVVAGNARTAVAADGTILSPDLVSPAVPQISVGALPPKRLADPHVLGQLSVLGAAPAPLAPRMNRIWVGAGGIAVGMSNGPMIIFGDASRPHAKWAAAAAVLADSGSAGASYIDVRIPERPAAGGLSSTATGVGSQVSSATDPTAATLAAELGAAVSGSSTAGSPVMPLGAGAGTTGATAGAGATAGTGPTTAAGAATGAGTTAGSAGTGAAATTGTGTAGTAGASGTGSTAAGAAGSSTTGTSGASGTSASGAGAGPGTTTSQASPSTGG